MIRDYSTHVSVLPAPPDHSDIVETPTSIERAPLSGAPGIGRVLRDEPAHSRRAAVAARSKEHLVANDF
jgi:hypothetical protein